jgi:hypothetical protein
LQIGDQIRKWGMSTFVPGDRTCTSACAWIWLEKSSDHEPRGQHDEHCCRKEID